MYQELGISNKVEELAIKAENELKEESVNCPTKP